MVNQENRSCNACKGKIKKIKIKMGRKHWGGGGGAGAGKGKGKGGGGREEGGGEQCVSFNTFPKCYAA